jgi:ABC-type Fe3+-hydroxamate transport system substrate-binding protein
MAASADTFLSDLLRVAGGVNVIEGAGGNRYPEVSPEDIAAWDPDLVLLPSEPYPFQAAHGDELVTSARIRRARFVFCDGELLTWHGVRTAKGLHAASQWLSQ